MLIKHVLPLNCYRKKLQNIPYLNCGLQFHQTVCGDYCKKKCYKPHITDLDELKQQLTIEWVMSSLWQSCASGESVSSWLVCMFLYHFSCNISHMRLSTGFKSGQFGGHSRDGFKSGVSFSNNSMVACAQWAYRVSQGSVETIVRWGGKRLYCFAANLVRKLCIKCHQNLQSFIGNFFSDTVYIQDCNYVVPLQCHVLKCGKPPLQNAAQRTPQV